MSSPKYTPPRRVMPGVGLASLGQRNLDERSFHLSKTGADTFSGTLSGCLGGTITGTLTLSGDLIHTGTHFSVFGAVAAAQPAGGTDVLAGLVTLGLRAASSNPPLGLGTGALTAGAVTLSGDFAHTGTHFGMFGTAPVVQQVGASAATIALITDANAKAAITSLQNAVHALGAITAPA